jgi:hypothetical protein
MDDHQRYSLNIQPLFQILISIAPGQILLVTERQQPTLNALHL